MRKLLIAGQEPEITPIMTLSLKEEDGSIILVATEDGNPWHVAKFYINKQGKLEGQTFNYLDESMFYASRSGELRFLSDPCKD